MEIGNNIVPTCAFAVLGIVMFAVWLTALVDLIRSDSKTDKAKLVWLLVILITGIIGALLYFALGRDGRVTEVDQPLL
jgi:hypothetical protein